MKAGGCGEYRVSCPADINATTAMTAISVPADDIGPHHEVFGDATLASGAPSVKSEEARAAIMIKCLRCGVRGAAPRILAKMAALMPSRAPMLWPLRLRHAGNHRNGAAK